MEHTINDSRGWAFVNDKALGFRQGSFFLSKAITLHFSSGGCGGREVLAVVTMLLFLLPPQTGLTFVMQHYPLTPPLWVMGWGKKKQSPFKFIALGTDLKGRMGW